MNILIFRLDGAIDALYERSTKLYYTFIGLLLVATIALTGVAAALAMPGSTLEALFGGTAGLLAFFGCRAIVTHYQRANPEDYRPPLRERMGLNRGKTLGAAAGIWLVSLIVLGSQGFQHPAIGALTILVALTLVVLATRTPEEKSALDAEANRDTILWSSDMEESYGGNEDEFLEEDEEQR